MDHNDEMASLIRNNLLDMYTELLSQAIENGDQKSAEEAWEWIAKIDNLDTEQENIIYINQDEI